VIFQIFCSILFHTRSGQGRWVSFSLQCSCNYIEKCFCLHLKQGYEVVTLSFPQKQVFDIMLWKIHTTSKVFALQSSCLSNHIISVSWSERKININQCQLWIRFTAGKVPTRLRTHLPQLHIPSYVWNPKWKMFKKNFKSSMTSYVRFHLLQKQLEA